MKDRNGVALRGDVLPPSDPKRHAQARRVHQMIVDGIAEAERQFLRVGRALIVVKAHKLHRQLGYPTLGAYLASPEVHLSTSHAARLMAIARAFPEEGYVQTHSSLQGKSLDTECAPIAVPVTDAQLAAVGVNKLVTMLPLVHADPEQLGEWLSRAETLTEGDLQLEVREAQDGPLTQRQELAHEIARHLHGVAATLRWSDELEATLDELLAWLGHQRAFLDQLSR